MFSRPYSHVLHWQTVVTECHVIYLYLRLSRLFVLPRLLQILHTFNAVHLNSGIWTPKEVSDESKEGLIMFFLLVKYFIFLTVYVSKPHSNKAIPE